MRKGVAQKQKPHEGGRTEATTATEREILSLLSRVRK
jgi:hypothetical protein